MQKWRSKGHGTLFGALSNGFPNAFFVGPSGAGVSYNLTSAFDVAARCVAGIVEIAHKQARDASKLAIEPTKQAEDRNTDELQNRALWFSVLSTCTPGWYTAEGEGTFDKRTPEQQAAPMRHVVWGSGMLDFKQMVSEYIARGNLDDFIIRT